MYGVIQLCTLQAYMVFKSGDKGDESSGMLSKTQASKFLGKARSGNSQYTSTNSSFGLEYAKINEQDIQQEFLRFCAQLEQLKEKNLNMGNRQLVSKIIAMQNAASRHDHEHGPVILERANCKFSAVLGGATDCSSVQPSDTSEDVPSQKLHPQGVSFAQTSSSGSEPEIRHSREVADQISVNAPTKREDFPMELNSREESSADCSPANTRNGRILKSGHARTHTIVINLDDKSRFTEEVTV